MTQVETVKVTEEVGDIDAGCDAERHRERARRRSPGWERDRDTEWVEESDTERVRIRETHRERHSEIDRYRATLLGWVGERDTGRERKTERQTEIKGKRL